MSNSDPGASQLAARKRPKKPCRHPSRSGATGKPVIVRPAMAVYGPRIPWDVATIRDVDVFSGPRLRKYLRRRARQGEVRPLTDEEIERIFKAANEAFPHHLSAGSPAR